ncbi:MAG: YIP1 family protein [Rubripirellula sp.]
MKASPEDVGGNPYRAPDHATEVSAPADRTVESHQISDVFRTIWFQPRVTMRWLIAERAPREAFLVISLAFTIKYFDNVLSSSDGSLVFGMLASPIAIPISCLTGMFVLVLMALLHRVVGRALGGSGDVAALRTAFAWSFAPTVFVIPISVLFLLVERFTPPTLFVPNLLFDIPLWILSAWMVILEIAGISAAHQFSIVRATFTFLLSIVIVGLIFALTVQAFLVIAFW